MSNLRVDSVLNVAGDDNPTLVAGTAQATTSGTAFDFTGIPAWVKRITVVFDGVSLSGTDNILVQLGDAGGIETTGYTSVGYTNNAIISSTSGFVIRTGSATDNPAVVMTFCKSDALDWVATHAGALNDASNFASGGGKKTLSDTLTQVRVTRTGSNTFDAGQVNLLWE